MLPQYSEIGIVFEPLAVRVPALDGTLHRLDRALGLAVERETQAELQSVHTPLGSILCASSIRFIALSLSLLRSRPE